MQGHIVQKVLHIYLENCQSTSDSLNELACSILPQVCLFPSNFPCLCFRPFYTSFTRIKSINYLLNACHTHLIKANSYHLVGVSYFTLTTSGPN